MYHKLNTRGKAIKLLEEHIEEYGKDFLNRMQKH